jgi:hypothetical protein
MRSRARRTTKLIPIVASGLAAAVLVSGCASSDSATTKAGPGTTGGATAPAAAGKAVLPVPKNPIANTATAPGLAITKTLVENNEDPSTGKAVTDHLEVALKNTTGRPLDQIEIYYKISDPTKGTAEGYYAKLDGFEIKPGASRVAHFDNTGRPDHFPVNTYSLYYVDKNELVVDVIASAPKVKQATFTVTKDAAGAEAGVE